MSNATELKQSSRPPRKKVELPPQVFLGGASGVTLDEVDIVRLSELKTEAERIIRSIPNIRLELRAIRAALIKKAKE